MKKLFLLGGFLVLGVLAITLFLPVRRHETLNGYIQKLRGKGEKMTQGYIEEIRALRANRSWTEVSSNLDSLNARMDALTNSVQKMTYLFTLVGTPNFKRAVWKCALTETERRLVITAIALKRYQKLNGEFPETLDRRVPKFMPSVPLDCMDGPATGRDAVWPSPEK